MLFFSLKKSPLMALVTAVLAAHSYSAPLPSETKDSQEKLVVVSNAGDADNLDINLLDKSRMEAELLSVLKERDQRSYEYLFSSLETLHGGFKELHEPVQRLQKLADDSLTGSVTLEEFLSAARDFKQSVAFLEDRTANIGLLPSLREDARGELSGSMDIAPLREHYQAQLAALNKQVELLRFRLALPGGALHQQAGIDTTRLQGMQLLSAAQINDMQKQVVKKKVMSTRERNVIDQSINGFTRRALEEYVDVFGTSERYRTSSDRQGRLNAAKALQDAFWARFYIRANYGIKIGSIPVNYQKQIFNADYLLSNVSVGAMTVWDENNLVRALNMATEAQVTQHSKGAGWVGSTLRYLSVWVGGQQSAEAAKQFIVDLVKMDLEQELALSKSGGLKKVRAAYRSQYFTSEEEKALYQQKGKVVFGDEDDDDIEADVGMIDAGTLKGSIDQCINVLEQMEIRLEEARKLQDSLAVLTSDNTVVTKRKKRASL